MISPCAQINGPRGLIEGLYRLIAGNGCAQFVIGIEHAGGRDFVKSGNAAALIGHLYRLSLELERPTELPSKYLDFPDIDQFMKPGFSPGGKIDRCRGAGMLEQ